MSYFYKFLVFYFSINLTYWLTSLYCYSTDDKIMVNKAFKKVFFNILILLIPFILISLLFIPESEFLLEECLLHLFIYLLTIDFWLYVTHYLSHSKYLYKYHKIHHEFKYPSSITALYTHWIDFYFNNLLPVTIMPVILQSNWITILIWMIYVTFNAVYVSHSRITLDKCHLIHHKYFKYNYGVGIYMDKLFGTYRNNL